MTEGGGRPWTTPSLRDRVIAQAQVEAERHREDRDRGGCTCGFCVWSVDHVLVMSMREALADVDLTAEWVPLSCREDRHRTDTIDGVCVCGAASDNARGQS